MLTLLYLLCLYSQSCFFSPALGEKIRFLFALSDSFSLSVICPLYICAVFLGNRFVKAILLFPILDIHPQCNMYTQEVKGANLVLYDVYLMIYGQRWAALFFWWVRFR
jgi:hypothetical protein